MRLKTPAGDTSASVPTATTADNQPYNKKAYPDLVGVGAR